jgi:methyl-accepting chemotaxis protein
LKNSYDFSRYLYKERILERNYESFITPLVVPDYYINYRKPVVTLGRNIKGRDLKTDIAILLVDIDLGIFSEITNRFPEKTGGDYYFVDARGILYHDAKGDRTGFAVTQETPLDHFSSVQGSEDFGVSMAGKRSLTFFFFFFYYLRSMLTGGLLICRIPRNLLLEGVDAIQLWISLIMVFTVLLASVIAYVISRTFALRVRNIVESAELLGRGEFDIPISVSGEDELGRIGRSFNRMREELKRFIEKAYVPNSPIRSSP